MKRKELIALRLHNQKMAGAFLQTPDEVVRWFGGVQSQEFGPAKWTLAQRLQKVIVEADVDHLLTNGTILRTHVLRPTWHFVHRDDLRWLVGLTGPRIRRAMATYDERLGLGDRVYGKCRELITQALSGGNQLTRKELGEVLSKGKIAGAQGQKLGHIMMDAEVELLVCSGAVKGKQQTYALVDERAPKAKKLDREEALAKLALIYFRSHGPATIKDFCWWTTTTAKDTKIALAAAGKELESAEVEGRTYYFAPISKIPKPAPEFAGRLLQAYDEYIVGYTESRDLLNLEGHEFRVNKGREVYYHAVVVGGQLLGHWRTISNTKKLSLDSIYYRDPDKKEHAALKTELERYGAFLRKPAELKMS